MQFQTIKMKIEDISECIEDEEFVPTNFDEKVNDFITSLFEDNMTPVSVGTTFTGEHAVCYIQYRVAMPEEIRAYQMMKSGQQPKVEVLNTEGLKPSS